MIKLQVTIALLILSLTAFGQNWKPYKLDDYNQVSLPEGFERKDTLGQTIITAQSSFGHVLITRIPDNPVTTPDIQKERHLIKYYDNFVNDIRKSTKDGSITNEKDTTLGDLRIKEITLAVDSGTGQQYRNLRILHENGATYTFQFLHQDVHSAYAAPELTTFFNSIKASPQASLETQFTDPENTTGKSPFGSRNIIIAVIVAGVIFILSLVATLRRRTHS